jgi:hypothetical protein
LRQVVCTRHHEAYEYWDFKKGRPITPANASPESTLKTPMATAMASSKLLLAAVKEKVAVSG